MTCASVSGTKRTCSVVIDEIPERMDGTTVDVWAVDILTTGVFDDKTVVQLFFEVLLAVYSDYSLQEVMHMMNESVRVLTSDLNGSATIILNPNGEHFKASEAV